MEEALIARLLANPGVSALVGARIAINVRGQNDNPPCIVVTLVNRQPTYHTGGQSDQAESRVQIDCWGVSGASALAVARAVKSAIPKAPWGADGIDFQSMTQISERTGFSGETATSRLHRVSIDFRVWHTSP